MSNGAELQCGGTPGRRSAPGHPSWPSSGPQEESQGGHVLGGGWAGEASGLGNTEGNSQLGPGHTGQSGESGSERRVMATLCTAWRARLRQTSGALEEPEVTRAGERGPGQGAGLETRWPAWNRQLPPKWDMEKLQLGLGAEARGTERATGEERRWRGSRAALPGPAWRTPWRRRASVPQAGTQNRRPDTSAPEPPPQRCKEQGKPQPLFPPGEGTLVLRQQVGGHGLQHG